MTPAQARALLKSAGMKPADIAQQIIALGDTRPPGSILRSIYHPLEKKRTDDVPWAIAALIHLLIERKSGIQK
jgi:hypothetical protein